MIRPVTMIQTQLACVLGWTAHQDLCSWNVGVTQAWEWVQSYIFSHLLPPGSANEDDFLTLVHRTGNRREEDSVTWLLGNYFALVCEEALGKDRVLGAGEVRAHLKQRLVAYRLRQVRPIHLPGL